MAIQHPTMRRMQADFLPRFGGQASAQRNPKPVALVADFDDTWIRWDARAPRGYDEVAAQGNIRALNAIRDEVSFVLNTGRALEMVKTAAKKAPHVFRQTPIDYLLVGNGQSLYVNAQHERADEWLADLSPADQDPAWARQVTAQSGWDMSRVRSIRATVFQRAGFAPYTPPPGSTAPDGQLFSKTVDNHRLFIRTHDSQGAFILYEEVPVARGDGEKTAWHLSAKHFREGEKIMRELALALRQAGIQLSDDALHMRHDTFSMGLYTLWPQGVDKGFGVNQLLANHFEDPVAVISAGDSSHNDVELLSPPAFQFKKPGKMLGVVQSVPNFPIISGQNTELLQQVQSPQREIALAEGYLGDAITRQFEKIKPLLGGRLNQFA